MVLWVWDEIRQDLWSHLQIEDGLVFWGEAHHAISGTLIDTLNKERQEMRKLATLQERSLGTDRKLTAADRSGFAKRCWRWPGRSTHTSSAMTVRSCP
jgi:hypothetical protein